MINKFEHLNYPVPPKGEWEDPARLELLKEIEDFARATMPMDNPWLSGQPPLASQEVSPRIVANNEVLSHATVNTAEDGPDLYSPEQTHFIARGTWEDTSATQRELSEEERAVLQEIESMQPSGDPSQDAERFFRNAMRSPLYHVTFDASSPNRNKEALRSLWGCREMLLARALDASNARPGRSFSNRQFILQPFMSKPFVEASDEPFYLALLKSQVEAATRLLHEYGLDTEASTPGDTANIQEAVDRIAFYEINQLKPTGNIRPDTAELRRIISPFTVRGAQVFEPTETEEESENVLKEIYALNIEAMEPQVSRERADRYRTEKLLPAVNEAIELILQKSGRSKALDLRAPAIA